MAPRLGEHGPGSQGLTPFAKRCPKVKKTGDPKKDSIALLQRDSFMQIISIIQADMSLAPLFLKALEDDTYKPDSKDDKEDNMWPSTYHQLWRLPKYWKGDLLVKACGTDALTHANIEAMNTMDPDAVDSAFYMMTQTTATTPLPRACLDKEICTNFFMARVKEVGSRIEDWATRSIQPNGTIDWKEGMAFELDFEGEKCTVTHRFTGDVACVPSEAKVCKDNVHFTQVENEMMTTLHCGKFISIELHSLFEPSMGPKKYHLSPSRKGYRKDSEFLKLAESLKHASDKKVAEQQANTVTPVAAVAAISVGDNKRKLDRVAKMEAAKTNNKSKKRAKIIVL